MNPTTSTPCTIDESAKAVVRLAATVPAPMVRLWAPCTVVAAWPDRNPTSP
ncbi:hypothetical protein ACQEV2_00475 [Streptomyces sp. CA-251387]|uniref:hypothetical protein n=1 Tax=Streptomyces sp. CA-251387 TaxID=3240064 RepID=UPI003D90CE49